VKQDWLYGIGISLPMSELRRLAQLEYSVDPALAAIAEEEAAAFMAATYVVRFMNWENFRTLCKALGVPLVDRSDKERRRATLRALRHWKIGTFRELISRTVLDCGMGRFRDVSTHPELWTDQFFREAYRENMKLGWLVQIRRHLHPEADIRAWLRSLGDEAAAAYDWVLDMGRLSLRRIVYKDDRPRGTNMDADAAAALQPEQVREKDRHAGAARQALRRLEQDRKALRQRTRQAEMEKQALVSQAQGEVRAERRALSELRRAAEREREQQARQHEAEVSYLRRQIAAARSEFLQALSGVRSALLDGIAVSVTGGDPELSRRMVETLGGTMAAEGAGVTLSGEAGPADLDRQLREIALQHVEIRCDGLRRRKGRRPAIAGSAFQVYRDGKVIHREGRVVCATAGATSLMAEYGAVLMALSWHLRAGPPRGARVDVWSDCRTMVDHVTGRRRLVQMRGCVMLDRRLQRLLRALQKLGCQVTLRWVPRERVDAEDRLCDRVYREATWYHQHREGRLSLPLRGFLKSL